ncbi:MurR/RpiR family transcriptional regulator [Acetonema longum]|uniref:Transcriptional regulator, RpiR family protein n=1 Tax=Acetonema longum DSM 6540 TaxID=1009370 RepID=F7NMN2_9FIRM|nr:MurR/RpiR family transcriptional regulator [Acetonema longum]EGO62696.1 transcriptional regulator, RpiR family protein [Acetonema longum DSM 6540]
MASSVIEPLKNIHEEISETDDMFIIMQKLCTLNIQNLEQTTKVNDCRELGRAVDIIAGAGQLLFFAMAGSGGLAMDACNKFMRTGIPCMVQTDSHWQAMYASLMKENDVVIAFSHSGSNKELIESITIARNKKAKVIAITGSPISPIAKVSDVVLVSYGKETMFRSEAMGSRVTALLVTDCLYTGVCLQRKDTTLQVLEKLRDSIARKRY